MPLSRQVVAHLLDGRITWTPRRDDGLYAFRGRVKFDGLFEGLIVTQGVTSPSGIEAVCNAELAEIRVRALAA